MIKEDILIKNTTREQREQIVNDALGIVDGLCDGCSQGIISMYDAYIDGLKELDEINREFNAHYEVDDKRGGNRGGCSMMQEVRVILLLFSYMKKELLSKFLSPYLFGNFFD